jgi:heptosyltransferase II
MGPEIAIERKICILLHHGLGDVAMAVSMLQSIVKHVGRQMTMYVVVKSDIEQEYVQELDLPQKVCCLILGHDRGYKGKLNALKKALILRKLKFDFLLAPHSKNSLVGNFFAFLVGAKKSVGPRNAWGYSATVDEKLEFHKVHFYRAFAAKASLLGDSSPRPGDVNITLKTDNTRQKSVFSGMEMIVPGETKYIVITPGSSPYETHKRWRADKYQLLIKKISSEFKLKTVVLGSPDEKDLLEQIKASVHNIDVVIQYKLSITESLHLISKSLILISGCTGALHLAAFSKVPVIALYGPTNPSITGPFTDRLRLVWKNYRCSPCYRRGFETGCGKPRCMEDIEVEDVICEVRRELAGKPYPELKKIITTDAKKPDCTIR